MGNSAGEKLENIDSIADKVSPVHRINFDGHPQYKSKLGGLCTVLIGIAFALLLAKRAIPVLKIEDPKV